MKTVYIAGKVTGLPIIEVTMKFGEAQKKLENLGYNVINPLEIVSKEGNGWHTPWDVAMRICIKHMMTADVVLMLPCWKDSKGAIVEERLAHTVFLPVVYDIKELPKIAQDNPPFFLDEML
jgi:hypothetical protein